MADETTQFILGDAAADALSEGRRGRGFFGRRRKSKKNRARLTNCENCGTALTGEYCAKCGQHAIDYRRSLLRVLIDAADSFLNWDTKFLKSVGILIARPWRLTNDFNAGRRARYVHPLRLYLLASIAFFLIAKLVNFTPSGSIDLTPEDRSEIDGAVRKLTAENSVLSAEQRAKVEALRAKFLGSDTSLSEKDRAQVDKLVAKLPRFAEKGELKAKDLEKLDAILDRIPALPAPPLPDAGPDSTIPPAPPTPQLAAPPRPNPFIHFDGNADKNSPFGAWLEDRVKKKVGEDGTNAQLFLDTLRSNVPTMMLCCIPLFAFVLKVLYLRQRRFYVEHLVYALHIHTFAYLAVVLITLIGMGAERWLPSLQVLLVVALSFLAATQVFLSIRRVYGQGWFMTTFKFLLGGSIYFVVLVLAVATTAFITLAMP